MIRRRRPPVEPPPPPVTTPPAAGMRPSEYERQLRREGYEPPPGLAEGLIRLVGSTAAPGEYWWGLLDEGVLSIDRPGLLHPAVNVDEVGSQDLQVATRAVDVESFEAILAAAGLGTREMRSAGGDHLHWAVEEGEKIGLTPGDILAWLLERSRVIVKESSIPMGTFHHAALDFEGFEAFRTHVRSFLIEHAPLVASSTDGAEFVIEFSSLAVGEPPELGRAYRTDVDGRLEEVAVLRGRVRLPRGEGLTLVPDHPSQFGDPFRGAPSDLFVSVRVPQWFAGPTFDDVDIWTLRHFTDLEELTVGFHVVAGFDVGYGSPFPVTDAGIRTLAAFPHLLSLGVRSSSVSDVGLQAFGRELEVVRFGRGPVTGVGLAAVTGSSTKVVQLEFTTSPLGSCRWLEDTRSLEDLTLRATGADDSDLGAIRGLPLVALDLGQNSSQGRSNDPGAVTDRAVEAAAGIRTLERLLLDGTDVTDAAATVLAEHASLSVLHLWRTSITDSALADLATIPSLKELSLADTAVTDAGVRRLKGLPLTTLDLSDTKVTEKCLDTLVTMSALQVLGLTDTNIPTRSLRRLAQLKKLTRLKIYTDAPGVFEQLQALLPGVDIDVGI